MLRPSALAFLLLVAGCGSSTKPAATPAPAPAAPAPAPAAAAPAPAPAAAPKLVVPPERAVQVTLPSGTKVTGDHVVAPAAGTPEEAIVQSINLISKGDFDGWIKTWCDPTLCDSPEADADLKEHKLASAKGSAKQCLGDDGNSVVVTRRDPVDANGNIHVYVYCGDKRMPAPAALHQRDKGYKVVDFSW